MRATIVVPATAANLGPGFDVFGLALDLVNEVTIDTETEPGVIWHGEGATELPVDGTDMVSATVARIAASMQTEVPPFALQGRHEIPLERGLGSSSAAAVTGVLAASLLLDLGWEHDPASVFAAAARVEGHPDNAAPAVFGGFTIAMPDGFVRRLDPHPSIRAVVLVPGGRLSTGAARRALPDEVSRADAVFNLAHAALTVEALTADPSLLRRAMRDRLHQAARVGMAGIEDVAADLDSAGAAWCVSGAGPALLVLETPGAPFDETGFDLAGWRVLRPGIRAAGSEVRRG
jgi:homoserine kinase